MNTPSSLLQFDLTKLKFILLSCALLLYACEKGKNPTPVDIAYQTYENDKLTIHHPQHWVLKFDESPNFSDDRAVIFEPSELSRVTILIHQDKNSSYGAIADDYSNRLRLSQKPSIKNYQRSTVKIAGKEGILLSWQETEFFERKVEVTILEIKNTQPKIFALFEFDEEDIATESKFIEPVAKSIQLN